jgi:sialic acid synthase SpsE
MLSEISEMKVIHPIKIIAEVGINHNGEKDVARHLIDAAAKAGVQCIKFQYRNIDRTYLGNKNEIGDEILDAEIRRSYLSPGDLKELCAYGKSLGLEVGVSFFIVEDINDFEGGVSNFDFFKVPSPELRNVELINSLLSFGRGVYISTGAHDEQAIEETFHALNGDNWNPFHCISNYPTELFNSRLNYLKYLQKKWNRLVGYSSHESDWRACIAALALGAKWIERHITFDKAMDGLDHSTSSTPDEFADLVIYAKYADAMLDGDGPRVANQGERMNLQNLGRSYHIIKPIQSGSVLLEDAISYRSPATGIGINQIKHFFGKKLLREGRVGQPLSESLFAITPDLTADQIEFLNLKKVSLPARFHDLPKLREAFPIQNFEMHLSFTELSSQIDESLFRASEHYSIHLPDYISSTELINPFSKNQSIRQRSVKIFENTLALATYLSKLTGARVPLVSSLSVVDDGVENFYKNCNALTKKYSDAGIELTYQTLPPFGWYFGGSVPLNAYCSPVDWAYIAEMEIPVTLDLSHLIMSCNYYHVDLNSVIHQLLPTTKHIHLSLADGIDGEGVGFSELSSQNKELILQILSLPRIKVIEVWQGHLNEFMGFRDSIMQLYALARGDSYE